MKGDDGGCADEEADAAAEAHRDGSEEGVLLGEEIVPEDFGEEEGGEDEDGKTHRGGGGEGDGDEEEGNGEGGVAGNSAAGKGTGGTVAEILGEIGEVIDDEARAIRGEADDDAGHDAPGPDAVAGEEGAAEGIAGNGEEVRGAEELEEGAGGHERGNFKAVSNGTKTSGPRVSGGPYGD